ncbi:hypothetical protein [Streptomyces sp. YIM 98790]|uniref:hypothetical protein n=1 Tax=Streptomyces sp. YIM 98790 TaxID=2689077 RepID=UPI001A9D53D7|nr:hypothetical protein [Streptomyces sp. YIM 98790]
MPRLVTELDTARSGIEEPHGIAVPADPARAAHLVARRLLPRYRHAAAAVLSSVLHHRSAATGQKVDISFDTWGRPQVTTTYPEAVLILARAGFRHDPRQECYVPPSRVSGAEADRRLAHVAQQLGNAGLHVTVHAGPDPCHHGQARHAPQPDEVQLRGAVIAALQVMQDHLAAGGRLELTGWGQAALEGAGLAAGHARDIDRVVIAAVLAEARQHAAGEGEPLPVVIQRLTHQSTRDEQLDIVTRALQRVVLAYAAEPPAPTGPDRSRRPALPPANSPLHHR